MDPNRPSLPSLPVELVTQISESSDLADLIGLWRVGGTIRQKIASGPTAVKKFIRHSKEAKLAQEHHITHAQALVRTYMRQEGFALAMPYSMALLARCEDSRFVHYSDGILCYTQQDLVPTSGTGEVREKYWVRILDVHGASETEDVIDMVKLKADLPGFEEVPGRDSGSIFLLENGILIMKFQTEWLNGGSYTMVVIDVRRNFVSTTERPSRIRKIFRSPLPERPFHIMTNGRYLVHVDIRKEVKWTLKCYDLLNEEAEVSNIALHEFLPRGQDCLFKLLDGWVYAICAHEEFHEFNSARDGATELYYNCCRFPIDDFGPAEKPEDWLGPESYTPLPARLQAVKLPRGIGEVDWQRICIDLVTDEGTGKPLMVESSRDMVNRDGLYRRIPFDDSKKIRWETNISEIVKEIPFSLADDVQESSYPPMREENIRIHVRPSQSIMDVTYDDRQVLHLYASSTNRGTWQFPPQSAPQDLRDFLTVVPGFITQMHDERSIIVTVHDREFDNWGRRGCQLILVNFDSGIKFPGFKYLPLDDLSDKLSSDGGIDRTETRRRSKELSKLQVELLQLNGGGSTTTPEAEAPDDNPSWFYTEPAKHLGIGQGFQFHPPQKPTAG